MKPFAWVAGVATLLAALGYMIVSLNRWEWNRALFFGLVVLIAEVALASALILSRLPRDSATRRLDPDVRDVLRDTRPPHPNRFEWLDPTNGRTNVFITFLVGGGVLLSAAAWLVDRLASHTTTRLGESRLARQLGPIGYPRGGLIVDDMTVLAQAVPGCDDGQLRTLLRRAGHEF
jgi:hypothetical protein